MEANHILIVEDDKEIREGVEIYLRSQGYEVFRAADGVEGLKVLEQEEIHLAIVDIMMSRMDGIQMTMKLREKYDFPVIMLSAKSEEVDKITGLNLGADDYVTKPFTPMELMARVNSQLRRYRKFMEKLEVKENVHVIGGLEINEETVEVTVDGKPVKLTPIEYKILLLLAKNPGRVFSAEEIYERVWQEMAVGPDTVMVHVRNIREKIERYTDYSITDEEGNILLESQQDVQEALESGQDGRYALKVEFVFDSHGQVSSVGVSGSRLDRETAYGMEQALISAQEDLEYDFDYNGFRKISNPENVTVRYGMTEENLTEYLYTGRMGDEESADVYWVLESDGFFWIFLLFVGITAAAAILLPFWKRTDGPALFRAPLEIVLLVAVIFFSTLFYQARMIWKTMNHELILIVSPAEAPVNTAVSYLLNFFVWAFSFGIVFWLVTCLRPMFVMGKEYWRQRVWTIRFILWVKRGGTRSVRGAKNTAGGVWQRFKEFLRRQYDLLLHFDFTDKTY